MHQLSENRTTTLGMDRAVDLAMRAADLVPAYSDHLAKHGIDPRRTLSSGEFRRLPPVTKKNYLQSYSHDELMWHGDITSCGTWSASSGSSGAPTYWPREQLALDESVRFLDRIFRTSFVSKSRTTLVIDGFAMGTWIGGTYTYLGLLRMRSLGHRLSVITPGINSDAILHALAVLGPRYEQVVLAGYPPFVKDVIDQMPAELLSQDIKILLAGEAISEDWRDHVLALLGKDGDFQRICLMYGTADAGVMGFETPLTTRIRRAARSDTELSNALFGRTSTQPTLVEYEPEFRFVEADDDGFLLFTVDSALPLIRYRINDRGNVLDGSTLRDLLSESGHSDVARQIDPAGGVIVLEGRPDLATIFYSLNIYPESFRQVFEHPSVINAVTGKFVVETILDVDQNPSLHIRAELSPDTTASDSLRTQLLQLCVAALLTSNSEYEELHQSLGSPAEPIITLQHHRSLGFETGIKHQWIGTRR